MAKVKVNHQEVSRFVRSFSKKLSQNIAISAKDEIEAEIIATILQGNSPVEGKRFKNYSEKYSDRFKNGRRRPVNMFKTGKMLDSLEVKQIRGRPGILIRFRDKTADFHDRLGAGKSKVIRRLLPRTRERFRKNIREVILKFFKKNVRKSGR